MPLPDQVGGTAHVLKFNAGVQLQFYSAPPCCGFTLSCFSCGSRHSPRPIFRSFTYVRTCTSAVQTRGSKVWKGRCAPRCNGGLRPHHAHKHHKTKLTTENRHSMGGPATFVLVMEPRSTTGLSQLLRRREAVAACPLAPRGSQTTTLLVRGVEFTPGELGASTVQSSSSSILPGTDCLARPRENLHSIIIQ